uniref:Metallopeptidase n=1 Tax=Schlesneria paludicola TaxID=360056 RepID=A0A7C4LLV0_9PLAN
MAAAWLVAAILTQVSALEAMRPPYTATAAYHQTELLGHTIYLHPELEQHPAELAAALDELARQLRNIQQVVPAGPLAELRKTPFWVEWERRPRGACEVHVSAEWLRANGYNPDKLLAVEINNVRNFVSWSRREQPWMVLHELAHAYHHRVLGARHPGLLNTFQQAKQAKLYESVKYIRGETRRAYALTNADEYFAELTEAYFGKNDFFPFTAEELADYDAAGFSLLEQIWGRPVNRDP